MGLGHVGYHDDRNVGAVGGVSNRIGSMTASVHERGTSAICNIKAGHGNTCL